MRSRPIIIVFCVVLLAIFGPVVFHEQIVGLMPGEKWDVVRKRQARLENIKKDSVNYRSFYEKYQKFYERITPEERENLRIIKRKIDSDPQGSQLNRELALYHGWLKTAPLAKARIDEAETIDERLEIINDIKKHQGEMYPAKSDIVSSDGINDEPFDSDLAHILESMDTEKRLKYLGYEPQKLLRELRLEYKKSEGHTHEMVSNSDSR